MDIGTHHLLVINKSGVSLNGECDLQSFRERSLRSNRIEDIIEVFKSVIPPKTKVTIVAESEGAYIAPDIALKVPEVERLILLSGGTRSWIEEEIMLAEEHRRNEVRDFYFNVVLKKPTLDQELGGATYAQIASYHSQQTLSALSQLRIPTLALNGTKDNVVWTSGVVMDYEFLRSRGGQTNLALEMLDGVGHKIPEVMDPEVDDLTKNVIRQRACEVLLSFMAKK